MPGGEDDLELRASMDDAVSSVLTRIEARIAATEARLDDLGRAGREAGENVDEGAEQAEEALRQQEEQTRRTREETKRQRDETKRLAEEQAKARAETERSSKAWAKMERNIKRSTKSMGGFSRLTKAMKWTVIIGAVFALAGAVGALGAAAAMAVGYVGSMIPALAAFGPLALAGALGMKAVTLALEEMEPQVNAIKGQFDGLGEAVAAGGFRSGMDYLSDSMGGFAAEVEQGFGWIGGSLGIGARALGDFVSEARRLDQTEMIFWSIANIIERMVPGLVGMTGGFMSLITASLGPSERLAGVLSDLGVRFGVWMDAQLASGRATEYINNSLDILLRTCAVVADLVAGLYRIFKIAAQVGGEFGYEIENLAQRFNDWTASVEGQASIRDYFVQAMPAIRELVLLIGDLLKMLAGLATSADTAALLAQIRTEVLPAFGDLLTMVSGADGLLPNLLDAATELTKLFTGLDMGAINFLVGAFADIVAGISSFISSTPGMSTLVGVFALFYVVGGALLSIIGWMVGAYGWLTVAIAGTTTAEGGLTVAQTILNWVLRMGRAAIFNATAAWALYGGAMGIATAIMGGVRTAAIFMWTAVTGPIGLVILAILAVIAIVVLLWNNCAWFRDAVLAAWTWIQNAAIATWEWIKTAAINTWNAISGAVAVAVAVIGGIMNWLWLNIIQPIWNGIVLGAQIAWNIISFIVQTAIYIIVAIITLLALILQGIWWVISTAATWAWQNVILPVIQFVAGIVIAIWTGVVAFFTWLWGVIVQQATFAWSMITTAAQAVAAFFVMIFTPIVDFFIWLWGVIVQQAQFAWATITAAVQAAVDFFRPVWEPIAAFFAGLFDAIGVGGRAAFDGISKAASVVAGVAKGAWDAVVGAVKGGYNALAGGWNSIPSITVPDWVPLIGGSTFSLPKLPTLWHGGAIQHGAAIVGEHGPEPLIGRGGNYLGMVGANGPEVATGLPRGGYVVPNLGTLTSMPGLLKTLPSGVASAVSRSVPGYGDLLRPSTTVVAPPAARGHDAGERELIGAVRGLTRAVLDRPPPISADGADTEAKILRALRRHDREKELSARYSY